MSSPFSVEFARDPQLPLKARRLAAGAYDFIALGYGPAVRITVLADATFTATTNYANEDLPLGALAAGFVHTTPVGAATWTGGACMVYFRG